MPKTEFTPTNQGGVGVISAAQGAPLDVNIDVDHLMIVTGGLLRTGTRGDDRVGAPLEHVELAFESLSRMLIPAFAARGSFGVIYDVAVPNDRQSDVWKVFDEEVLAKMNKNPNYYGHAINMTSEPRGSNFPDSLLKVIHAYSWARLPSSLVTVRADALWKRNALGTEVPPVLTAINQDCGGINDFLLDVPEHQIEEFFGALKSCVEVGRCDAHAASLYLPSGHELLSPMWFPANPETWWNPFYYLPSRHHSRSGSREVPPSSGWGRNPRTAYLGDSTFSNLQTAPVQQWNPERIALCAHGACFFAPSSVGTTVADVLVPLVWRMSREAPELKVKWVFHDPEGWTTNAKHRQDYDHAEHYIAEALSAVKGDNIIILPGFVELLDGVGCDKLHLNKDAVWKAADRTEKALRKHDTGKEFFMVFSNGWNVKPDFEARDRRVFTGLLKLDSFGGIKSFLEKHLRERTITWTIPKSSRPGSKKKK